MSSVQVKVNEFHCVILLVVVDKFGVDSIDYLRVELTFFN